MQKTILLHIGTAKTGSTSIQKWLAHAQESGNLAQISYPLWGRSHNQQRLVSLYRSYHELPLPMCQSYGPGGGHYERMRNQYRKYLFKELGVPRQAILSGESLCGLLSPSLITRLREDLEASGFRDFHIIMYVRDPADFYLSRAQQQLKMTTDLPRISSPTSFRYEFFAWARAWEEVFPGKLIVRKYPPEKHGDIIEDFSSVLQQRLGIQVPWAPMKMNTSLSTEGMQILHDYRETFSPDDETLTPDTSKLIDFLEHSKQILPQTKPVLKREIAELIRANHKDDAKLLQAKYGIDLGLESSCPELVLTLNDKPDRVADIVEFVDPDIVQRLLMQIAKKEFSRPRPLVLRMAASIYRNFPLAPRPKGLEAWLRRLLKAD